MGINTSFISNKNSKEVINNSPKLPLATDLADGEIAVNFAKDYETLAIKNESGDVVTFSSDNKFYKKSETSGATEIQTALGNKQDELISGSNIKTINNTSILGSGNITIEGGSGGGFITVTNPSADTKVGLVNSLTQYYDTNIGKGAVIEGDGYEYNGTSYNIVASGELSHAEGYYAQANGDYSHAEGNGAIASGDYGSHAEGNSTTASGSSSHAEGNNTKAFGNYSHAEGYKTTASGDSSHAEGYYAQANGNYSHAEGGDTKANDDYSHAEGSGTIASGSSSHAEGYYTQANGYSSHAEGQSTQAIGDYGSHAEGQSSKAFGWCAHAEGDSTQAIGYTSHTEGQNTIAINGAEHASGYYNISNSGETAADRTLFSVGNGYKDWSQWREYRHNAFEIRQNGDIYISSGGTNTSPMVKLQDNLGGNVDLSNYYTKTEVDEIVDDVVAGQIDLTTYAKIDWVQTNYALKTDVPKIWTGTQSEYDAITNKDSSTIYFIK